MKILISSHAFAPSVGGIETVSGLLAREFVALGHETKVVTQTESKEGKAEKGTFEILRRPSLWTLAEAIGWCDVYWQSNLSLRTLWPTAWMRKPVVITHHGSYCRPPVGLDLLQRMKHAVVERTRSVAVSQAVAACFRTESVIVPNPYDVEIFRLPPPERERKKELVFLGRLIAEKGVDLLLEALSRLRQAGLRPGLTIIGDGPERRTLERHSVQLDLDHQVEFVGTRKDRELARLLQEHEVLVVPSRYDEPFGVVALEGIACGCVVIGSNGGGLPEAIGPCGVTFRNGDLESLTATLQNLLGDPEARSRLRAQAGEHLLRFQPRTVAQQYLSLFQSLL